MTANPVKPGATIHCMAPHAPRRARSATARTVSGELWLAPTARPGTMGESELVNENPEMPPREQTAGRHRFRGHPHETRECWKDMRSPVTFQTHLRESLRRIPSSGHTRLHSSSTPLRVVYFFSETFRLYRALGVVHISGCFSRLPDLALLAIFHRGLGPIRQVAVSVARLASIHWSPVNYHLDANADQHAQFIKRAATRDATLGSILGRRRTKPGIANVGKSIQAA
jgi:hypothetical protein